MASARDIKRRIKSVKSTQQITKAMKMVSAAKLRRSQAAVMAVRPFTRKIDHLLLDLGASADHPYLRPRPQLRRVCYLVIGSDRGLCGGFNGNLHRFLDRLLAQEQRPFAVVAIGRRLSDYCLRRGYPLAQQLLDIGDTPGFDQALALSALLRAGFDAEEYDAVYLVYNQFKSAMVQIPCQRQLLPVEQPEEAGEGENIFSQREYILEPDAATILAQLLPQYVDIGVYCALQEAKASEHGARMTAMSSATDNAGEMIGKLTLSLNRARQAAITTEISEIVGGADALQ